MSRALFEQVAFNQKQVTSLDWVTYPILRFKDSPKVDFEFVQRYDIPATNAGDRQANGTSVPSATVAESGVFVSGSGEPPLSSIGAAIANAFFDATGARIRRAPMAPARPRGAEGGRGRLDPAADGVRDRASQGARTRSSTQRTTNVPAGLPGAVASVHFPAVKFTVTAFFPTKAAVVRVTAFRFRLHPERPPLALPSVIATV